MGKRVIIQVILLFALVSVSFAQKMIVKDSDANVLMEVNDEGTVGSVTLPSGAAPSTTTNKLYNVSGVLWWNGSQLGTASSAGGWTDGGTKVYLTTLTDSVGIGTNSPGTPFAVANLPGASGYNKVLVNTATGDFYFMSSSRRYKEDIQNLEDDFHKILDVEPRSFIDKASGKREIGFIAEEFEEKGLKNLVIYNDKNIPNGLKYDMVPLYLVEIVKEQQKKIAELEKRVIEMQK